MKTPKLSPKLFREYDIRGIVPWLVDKRSIYFGKVGREDTFLAPLDIDEVYVIGKAFAEFVKPKKVLVGKDTRLSAPKFFESLASGLTDSGVDVYDAGITTTSMVYFGSGAYDFDAAINVTASHTPREINGFKMVKRNAYVIGAGSGMEELRDIAFAGKFSNSQKKGIVRKFDILNDYVGHVCNIFDPKTIGKFKLVLDASNGPIYLPASKLLDKLACEVVKLNFEPDGDFPAHDPNPLIPENRKQIEEAVKKEKADLGVIWDGDADRVMIIDERGELVPGDFVTALIAKYFLQKNPGATIVYNAPSSWVVKDTVEKFGGKAVMQRTGHAFIKQKNREVDAIFAGEHSAHFYFKDTFYAENDLLPVLIILELMNKEQRPFSELISKLGNYYVSGEMNFEVEDKDAVIKRIEATYKNPSKVYFIDGISVEFADWHFNVRPSANDPVIRLNVETKNKDDLTGRIEEVSKLIGGKHVP